MPTSAVVSFLLDSAAESAPGRMATGRPVVFVDTSHYRSPERQDNMQLRTAAATARVVVLATGTTALACHPTANTSLPNSSEVPMLGSAVEAPRTSAPLVSAALLPEASIDGVAAGGPAAYDLVRDVALRSTDAKRQLGPGARLELIRDVFVIAGPNAYHPSAFQQTLHVVRRALDAYFHERFNRGPDRAVTVLLFPDAPGYNAFCQELSGEDCFTPYGFYAPTERRMVMNIGLGVGTLTHELVHPIIEADFPEAPTWIDEGIASLFENFGFPGPGQITGYTNWRLPRLQQALKSSEGPAAELPRLFAMPDATFRNDQEDLHYAMARYFCQWLERRGQLWAFYQRWRDSHELDPTGVDSFQETTGLTPEQAAPQWRRWVRAL